MKPIKRQRIKPQKIEADGIEMPEEWFGKVDTSKSPQEIISEVNEPLVRKDRRRRRVREFLYSLVRGAEKQFPIIKPITQLITRPMARDKATKFYQKFQTAEGIKQWFYGAGALAALGVSFFDPTWGVYVLAALAGGQAFISKYEKTAGED